MTDFLYSPLILSLARKSVTIGGNIFSSSSNSGKLYVSLSSSSYFPISIRIRYVLLYNPWFIEQRSGFEVIVKVCFIIRT